MVITPEQLFLAGLLQWFHGYVDVQAMLKSDAPNCDLLTKQDNFLIFVTSEIFDITITATGFHYRAIDY